MTNHARTVAKAKAIASEPFDATSMLEEVQADARVFVLNGEEFSLPPPTAWPDEAFEAANRDDPLTASKLILGDDEYERFKKVGGNALFLQRLVEKLHGAPLGESSASSSS